MKLRKAAVGLCILVLAATAGAFGQKVNYDYDTGFDFAPAKTYAWAEGTPVPDPFSHQRILDAVDAELARKGLRKAPDGETADLRVAYHASFDRDLRIDGFGTGFGPYRWGGARSGRAIVDEILVGTLVVDLAAEQGTRLVWRGVATKEIDPKASPEKREKNIRKAAEKMFKNFPPPAQKK